jgi:hypothetical protein
MISSALEVVLAAAFGFFAVLFGAWGLWLLLTDDPDGGRHPFGALMVGIALGAGVMCLLAVRRRRPRNRD